MVLSALIQRESTPLTLASQAEQKPKKNYHSILKRKIINMKTKTLLLLAVVILFNSCTDEKNTKRVLEVNGYKVIKVRGHPWFTSGGELYKTKFTAVAPNGKDTVTGYVTSGFFKGSTIRLY